VVITRAGMLGIEVLTGDFNDMESFTGIYGALVQYPPVMVR